MWPQSTEYTVETRKTAELEIQPARLNDNMAHLHRDMNKADT